jgi:DNA processing protein
VGSRQCTRDGQRAARDFARGLAENGVTVVSGMARGIDSCAHRGALDGHGPTLAVLGCGVDVVYPPENDRLMAEILDSGGAVVSEFVPGTPPTPGNFPARNRIISGLCEGMLIVEGAKASGAMITVNLALEQGRDVFAVPGSIYSPLSAAPNQMILDGAFPALSPWDILEHYRWGQRPAAGGARKAPKPTLDPEEEAIVAPLRNEALSFEELIRITGLSAAKLNSHLTMLELRGIIDKAPGGLYRAYT